MYGENYKKMKYWLTTGTDGGTSYGMGLGRCEFRIEKMLKMRIQLHLFVQNGRGLHGTQRLVIVVTGNTFHKLMQVMEKYVNIKKNVHKSQQMSNKCQKYVLIIIAHYGLTKQKKSFN